jgi:hypothetical protein
MGGKGAIPIPYIVAIIFAIIIIVIIGYWFFTTSNTGSSASSATQCLVAKSNFCQDWIRRGYQPTGATQAAVLAVCAVTTLPYDVNSLQNCKIFVGMA